MAMKVAVPDYANVVAKRGHELVLSTPGWYRKHGAAATVFADVTTWPPKLVRMAMRVGAATRLPDGEWLVLAKPPKKAWQLAWYESISASEPTKTTRLPKVPDHDPGEDEEPVFGHLCAVGDVVIGVPQKGHAFVLRDGKWKADAKLPVAERAGTPRVVKWIDGREVLEWSGQLFADEDGAWEAIDARGCHHFTNAGKTLFALHDSAVVEVKDEEIVVRLPHREAYALEPGPRGTLEVSLTFDTDRGRSYEIGLFDPAAQTLAMLEETLAGGRAKIVGATKRGDLVIHTGEAPHELVIVTKKQLAELPSTRTSELAPFEVKLMPVFDERGAASRPIVAATGDRIVIAVENKLRFHSVDVPKRVVELAHPVIGVVAAGPKFAAVDASNVMHTYDLEGKLLGSKPVLAGTRSIATDRSTVIVIGNDDVALVDDGRTRSLGVPAGIAAAADPEGNIVVAAEDHRLVHWTGNELRELPPTSEQIIAVTAIGVGLFACSGQRELYLLDLRNPELLALERRARVPSLAGFPAKRRIALCTSATSVEIDAFENGALTPVGHGVSYSKYSEPPDEEVNVHGLAFLGDGRLVIALDVGRGNIVEPDTGVALKLDPQPGDARSRWVFICGGNILIAD